MDMELTKNYEIHLKYDYRFYSVIKDLYNNSEELLFVFNGLEPWNLKVANTLQDLNKYSEATQYQIVKFLFNMKADVFSGDLKSNIPFTPYMQRLVDQYQCLR